MLSHGSKKDCDRLQKLLNEGSDAQDLEEHYFISKYSLPFWHSTIQWMHQVNNKCVTPLGYWDTVQEYRGVSRVGRQLASALAVSLPLRTYDKFKEAQIKEYEYAWKHILTTNNGVMVSDNFNRNYRLHGLRTEESRPYQSMNLMINAVQAFPDRLVNPFPFQYLSATGILPSISHRLSIVESYFKKIILNLSVQ